MGEKSRRGTILIQTRDSSGKFPASARGSVRGLVGLKLEGAFKGEHFLMGDVDADCDYDRGAIHIFFAPNDATGLLFPMVGRRVRAFAQIPDGVDVDRQPSLDWMREARAARHMNLSIETPHWITRFEIHHAQLTRHRVGRVFLAGDAAHVHSPAGGQGMNTGIQDAMNLSWKLALASRGGAGEAPLDSYHDERHPVAAHVIGFSTWLTDMGTVSSSFLRHLRDAAVRTAFGSSRAQHLMANEIEEQNVRYRGSAIVAGNGADTKSGDFFRDGDDAPVTHALQAPDVAARVAHVAIVLPGRNGARPSFQIPEAVETLTLADPNDIFAQRVGLGSAGGLVLVRPDGYIGLIAPPTDADAATNYFARLMR
jgi:hypothetical protein